MKYKSKIEGNESVTLTFKDKTAIEINSCITNVHGYVRNETRKSWNCRINVGHKFINLNINKNEWEKI